MTAKAALKEAIERLRSGALSLTSAASTLAITYNELRSALKDALGADGYTALMAANHAAVKSAKPAREPRAPREASASTARPKPDDTDLPRIKSMNKSEGWTWRRISEHETRAVQVTVHKGEKNEETYGINDAGEQYLIVVSPEGTEFVQAFEYEPATLLREVAGVRAPMRFVEWERSELKKQIDRDTHLGEEEIKAREEAAAAKKKAKENDAPPTIAEAAGVKPKKRKALKPTKSTKRRSTK